MRRQQLAVGVDDVGDVDLGRCPNSRESSSAIALEANSLPSWSTVVDGVSTATDFFVYGIGGKVVAAALLVVYFVRSGFFER